MKKKIVYGLCTAVLCGIAFFAGKNHANDTCDFSISEITMESQGLYTTLENNDRCINVWIPTDKLESVGLISTDNIVDWNTDGYELVFATENGTECYAYYSKEVFDWKLYAPLESEVLYGLQND